MKFFLDNNQPQQLARLLDKYDTVHEVSHLTDDFHADTPDTVWLAELGHREQPPAVIAADARILRNPAEAQVLREAKLTYFLMADGWSGMKWAERAWKMVRVWPKIIESATPRRPTIYKVSVQEKIEHMGFTEELKR